MILMHWTNEANSEDDELAEAHKADVGDFYFTFNQTANYFPNLKYNDQYVPLGSSTPMCAHL